MKLFAENPRYVRAEQLLRQLSGVVAAGDDGTDATEEIREEASELWQDLTIGEQRRLQRLSAELDMLSNAEIPRNGNDPVEDKLDVNALARSVEQAMHEKKYDHALDLLRLQPHVLPPATVAYARARLYYELGHFESSLVFLQFALKLDPGNEAYEILVMSLMLEARRENDAVEFARNCVSNPTAGRGLLIFCVIVLAGKTYTGKRIDDRKTASEIVSLVMRALEHPHDRLSSFPLMDTAPYAFLALAYQELGDSANALAACNTGIRLNQSDANLFVVRAIINSGHDRENAAVDCERAIAMGTTIVLAYISFALYLLDRGDFHRLLKVCDRALGIAEDTPTRAHFTLWRAISWLELGAGWKSVRRELENARDLDPGNSTLSDTVDLIQSQIRSPASARKAVREARRSPDFKAGANIDSHVAAFTISSELLIRFSNISRMSQRHLGQVPA